MPRRSPQASIEDVVTAATNIDWSVCIRDAAGDELARCNPDSVMETASVGKLLLLLEVARRCDDGNLAGTELLSRDAEIVVADSGIWQHLHIDTLPILDLCVLVASVSDNVATNVLLHHVGLERLRDLAASLGLVNTALLDYIRVPRGPADPPTFSTGSASELSHLMGQIHRNELISQAASEQVNTWLATSVDLSMVAAAFGLDPLSHATSDDSFVLRNKTGADTGIRADVGTIGRKDFWLSYAAVANWDPAQPDLADTALSGMAAIGNILRTMIESDSL